MYKLRFYCDVCEEIRPVIIEPIAKDNRNEHPWGDIICSLCRNVIATVESDTEGTLEFREK